MADKQALLKDAVPDLVRRLVNPRCVDPQNPSRVVGTSTGGVCVVGALEFPSVHDLHIGVVSSALGGRGGNACGPAKNLLHPELDAHNDDQAHLLARGGDDEHAIADMAPSNFLAWFPPTGTNQNGAKPTVTAIEDPARFARDFQDLVAGVHEFGCGFEAQLESWYRFLVQPDPYATIEVDANGRAQLVGVDEVILKQRHDFLRPDSLVAVILLTDENDSTVDPLALDGRAWGYENPPFPDSPTGRAPRPTSACAESPDAPACTSCATAASSGDPSCTLNDGYYAPPEDDGNVRFFHMKQRFGVDPQFPVQRYIDALTSARVPDRAGEHGSGSTGYLDEKNCTNPLFAKDLPADARGELCALARGPRSLDLVYFAIIGGVPNSLLHFDPNDPAKNVLTSADWRAILGADPLHYDFTGVDPHMRESIEPRAGLPGLDASNTADPIHGREWDTKGVDLQYACTFPLATPRDCSTVTATVGCDCKKPSPVCDAQNPLVQLRGKAYPPVRELVVARALGDRGIVSSLCPIHPTPLVTDDPLYGYRPAMKTILDRLKAGLQ